jgi:hypothetical protein
MNNLLYNPPHKSIKQGIYFMAKRKRILITRENVHEFSRLKKVQDIEYRVVCGKDIITGEEAIHIAPSKNTLHEEIMMEMIKRNPAMRDMAGRVLLYDMGNEPVVYFSAADDWGMLTSYWQWDDRVSSYLEPKIKQVFLNMKTEGKTATLHIDHSKDYDADYWDKVFGTINELDTKFAGRDLMQKIHDYAPQNIREEDIKIRSLRALKREKRLEQSEAVRARQDAKMSRPKMFLWKQACRDGD